MKHLLSFLSLTIVLNGFTQSKKEVIEDLTRKNDSLTIALISQLKKSEIDSVVYSEKIKQLLVEVALLESRNRILTNKIDSLNSLKPKPEDFLLGKDYYTTDTVYDNVLINDERFNIYVLSDKYDEHMEPLKFDDMDEFMNNRSRTIVATERGSGKIVFVKKIDVPITEIRVFKPGGAMNEVGPLFLQYISSAGGSGFSGELFSFILEEGKIELNEIVEFGELDLFLFHKQKNQIVVLKGIWSDELDEEGVPIEAHFSEHRYEVLRFTWENGFYNKDNFGKSKLRYPSLDGEMSAVEILGEMLKKERFLPSYIIPREFY